MAEAQTNGAAAVGGGSGGGGIQIACHIVPNLGIAGAQSSAPADTLPTAEAASLAATVRAAPCPPAQLISREHPNAAPAGAPPHRAPRPHPSSRSLSRASRG